MIIIEVTQWYVEFDYAVLFLFVYLWLHWVFIAAHGLSLVRQMESTLWWWCTGLLTEVASLVAEHGL